MTTQSELVPTAPDNLEMMGVPTEEIRARLRIVIGLHRDAITQIATLWRELVRRGENTDEFRFSLSEFLLPVADGRLLPELVSNYAGQIRMLRRIAELSLADQLRIVRDEPVELFRGAGVIEAVRPSALTFSEGALAIREGRIWTGREQEIAYSRSKRAAARPRRGRKISIVVQETGMTRIGKTEIETERLVAALRAAGVV